MAKQRRGKRARGRMGQPTREELAKMWFEGEVRKGRPFGRRQVQRYARRFRVTAAGALLHLEKLGVVVDPVYAAAVEAGLSNTARARAAKAGPLPECLTRDDEYGVELGWDEHFAFIAGFTSGGAAFGTTWEEAERHDHLPSWEPKTFDRLDQERALDGTFGEG